MAVEKRVIRESIEVGSNVVVSRSGGRSVNVDTLLSSDDVIKTLRTIANRMKEKWTEGPQEEVVGP